MDSNGYRYESSQEMKTYNFQHQWSKDQKFICPKCYALIPMVDPFPEESDPRSTFEKHIEWHKWLHLTYRKGNQNE